MNNPVERLWPPADVGEVGGQTRPHLSSVRDEQAAKLEVTLGELQSSFEDANRRVNRLIGEKKQLSALLAKRDDRIEELSRDLGEFRSLKKRYEAGTDEIPHRSNAVGSSILSLVKRAEAYLLRSEPINEEVVTLAPDWNPGTSRGDHLVAGRGGEMEHRIIGVLLFGLEKYEIEHVLPSVIKDCLSRQVKPLCLTDIDAFELFREHDVIFEYMPSEEDRDRFDMSLNWALYVQRRLAIIRRKWNPVRIVAFGGCATKVLGLWTSSPFEDTPLPAASIESVRFS